MVSVDVAGEEVPAGRERGPATEAGPCSATPGATGSAHGEGGRGGAAEGRRSAAKGRGPRTRQPLGLSSAPQTDVGAPQGQPSANKTLPSIVLRSRRHRAGARAPARRSASDSLLNLARQTGKAACAAFGSGGRAACTDERERQTRCHRFPRVCGSDYRNWGRKSSGGTQDTTWRQVAKPAAGVPVGEAWPPNPS